MTQRAAALHIDERELPGARLALANDPTNSVTLEGFAQTTATFNPCAFLEKLPGERSGRVYQRGEVVFSQGAVADAVFWILSGTVKLSAVSRDGKEGIIALLQAGSFFGEECLAGQPLCLATAVAMQTSDVVRFCREAMSALLRRDLAFAEGFTAYLLSRHIRMEQDLLDQLFNSSEKRLARLLLLMAHYGEQAEPLPVIDRISHETLAEMIGTTRSRVTFFLNRFRKLGFIDYDHGMHVHSSLLKVVLRD